VHVLSILTQQDPKRNAFCNDVHNQCDWRVNSEPGQTFADQHNARKAQAARPSHCLSRSDFVFLVPQRWVQRPLDPLHTGMSSPLERLQQRYPQKGGGASIRQVWRAWESAFEAGPAGGQIAVSRYTIPLCAHSRRRGTCSPASPNTGPHASSYCPCFKPDSFAFDC
jgi:hypothetical protein